jgi:hypothetical protein
MELIIDSACGYLQFGLEGVQLLGILDNAY